MELKTRLLEFALEMVDQSGVAFVEKVSSHCEGAAIQMAEETNNGCWAVGFKGGPQIIGRCDKCQGVILDREKYRETTNGVLCEDCR